MESIVRKNLSTYDYIAGPVIRMLFSSNHWCLQFFSVKTMELVYIYPLLADLDKLDSVLSNWNKFCEKRMGLKDKRWKSLQVSHLIQTDSFNCGVYICHFYNLFIKQQMFSLSSAYDINGYRNIITSTITDF